MDWDPAGGSRSDHLDTIVAGATACWRVVPARSRLPSQPSSVMLPDWRPGSNSYLGVVTQIRGLFACPHPGGM